MRAALALLVVVQLVQLAADAEAHRPGSRRARASAAILSQGGGPTLPWQDPSVVPVAIFVGASFGSAVSSQGPSTFLEPEPCPGDAGVCGLWVEEGQVVPAVDPVDGGIRYQLGATQGAARAFGRPVVLVQRHFPGTPVTGYSMDTITSDLDVVAAWAADRGWTICPIVMSDNSGGYNENAAGDPFSAYLAALDVHRATVQDHLAARVAATTAGFHPDCTTFPFLLNGGDTQHWGVTGVSRHRFVDDFASYAQSPGFVAEQFYFVRRGGDDPGDDTGSDRLHPNTAGGEALARAYALSLQRILARGRTYPPVVRDIRPTGPDTLRLSIDVPCRFFGGCLDDPPITLDDTNVAPQEDLSGARTYGVHLYLGGDNQAAPAVTEVVFHPCPPPLGRCDVTLRFAEALEGFDEISIGDTAEVNTAAGPTNPRTGGTNFVTRLDPSVVTCAHSRCEEWVSGNAFARTPHDAGAPPDSGEEPDSGDEPDAGEPEDAGEEEDAGDPDAGDEPDAGDAGDEDAGGEDSGPDAGSGVTFTSSVSATFASGATLSRAVPTDDLWAPRDGLTVLVWARPFDTFVAPASRWGGGGASTEVWWIGRVPGFLAIGFGAGGTGRDCNAAPFNVWHQVGFTFDGSQTDPEDRLHCVINGAYADGALQGSVGAQVDDEQIPLTLAGGNVDTLTLFDCGLSEAEVARVYCSTHGAGAAGCDTAGPGGESVGVEDFGSYVLAHPCFIDWCDFEAPDNAECLSGLTFTPSGTVTYTGEQP